MKGLWRLLLPTGRRISIETLTGKRLAIDASIWLTQFIKANRDPETGAVRPAAHLIGFLRRICKLLYHGIRPIFVFDGATPQIKLRELRARRDRREKLKSFGVVAGEGDDEGVKRMARRLLVANLKKQKDIESASNKLKEGKKVKNTVKVVKAAGAFTSTFNLAGENDSSSVVDLSGAEASSTEKNEVRSILNKEYNDLIEETSDFLKNLPKHDDPTPKSDWDSHQQDVIDVDGEIKSDEDDDDSYQIPEDEEEFDADTLYSLPSHMRKDVIEKLKRQQRLHSRSEFMSVAANPESYSQVQLKNFLKSSSLNKKIMDVGKNIAEESNGMVGEKIASDSNVRFIFEKDDDECAKNQSRSRKRESKLSLELASMKLKRLKRLDGKVVPLSDLGFETSSDNDKHLQKDCDESKRLRGTTFTAAIDSDTEYEGGFIHDQNCNSIINLTKVEDPVEQKIGTTLLSQNTKRNDGAQKGWKRKKNDSTDEEEDDIYFQEYLEDGKGPSESLTGINLRADPNSHLGKEKSVHFCADIEKKCSQHNQQRSNGDKNCENGADVDTEDAGEIVRNNEQAYDNIVRGDNQSCASENEEEGEGFIRNNEQAYDGVVRVENRSYTSENEEEGGGFIRNNEQKSGDVVRWGNQLNTSENEEEGGFFHNNEQACKRIVLRGNQPDTSENEEEEGEEGFIRNKEQKSDVFGWGDQSNVKTNDKGGAFIYNEAKGSDDDVAWENGSDTDGIESAFILNKKEESHDDKSRSASQSVDNSHNVLDNEKEGHDVIKRKDQSALQFVDDGEGVIGNEDESDDDIAWEDGSDIVSIDRGVDLIYSKEIFLVDDSDRMSELDPKESIAKASTDTLPSSEKICATISTLPISTTSLNSLPSNEITSFECKSLIGHKAEAKNAKDGDGVQCHLKATTQGLIPDVCSASIPDQTKDSDMKYHLVNDTGIEQETSHAALYSPSVDKFLDEGQGELRMMNSKNDLDNPTFEKEGFTFGQLENENNANREALQQAHQTAANLTDWAGRAVRRAIAAHLDENEPNRAHDSSKECRLIHVKDNESQEVTGNLAIAGDRNRNKSLDNELVIPNKELNDFDISNENIEEEAERVRLETLREKRDIDTVTDDMIEDIMQLLNLCGIPYIKAPAEAEAQCTELEKLGLADGVVTEDSDGE